MKQKLVYSIILILIITIVKYFYSNYRLEYNVGGYRILTVFKNNRLYYEITKDEKKYNFDIYAKRSISRKVITKIDEINEKDFNCIYPVIEKEKTYPLCYYNNEYTDYHLIDSSVLDVYKKSKEEFQEEKDFYYNNNLNKDEYIALWNYKGYIVMNNKSYRNIDLFKNDKYDNSLAILINNKIYTANIDEEHEYGSITSLDLKNYKVSKLNLNYKIDFDSYIVGNIKNNLYIYDNKYSILYEINIKNGKTKIIGNNEIGFVKYENGKFISCSKSTYKLDKYKYNIDYSTNYYYDVKEGIYKSIKENNSLKQKILNYDVNIIKERENILFYQYKDFLYRYSPFSGSEIIFYNYELNFNSNNTIFVYID